MDLSRSNEEMEDLQLAAEEGFNNKLQRQLAITRTRLQSMETMYQETVKKAETEVRDLRTQLLQAKHEVQRLTQENKALQENIAVEMIQKSELKEKCHNLQLEKEKVMRVEDHRRNALVKAQAERAILEDKQVESGNSETSELAAEVLSLRRVIASLKEMVLMQKHHLDNHSAALSMSSHPSMLHSMRPRSLRSASDGQGMSQLSSRLVTNSSYTTPTPSWEMVNGSQQSVLNSRYQQQQEQQQQLKAMQQRIIASSSSNQNAGGLMNAVSGHQALNGKTTLKQSEPSRYGGSQSVVIQRAKNVNAAQPRSKTEVIRAHTDQHVLHPLDWTDGDAGKHQEVAGFELPQHSYLGLKQFAESGLKPAVVTESTQAKTAHPRNAEFTLKSSLSPAPCPQSLLTDSSSTCGPEVFPGNGTVPYMHILNQTGMAGACVIRNSSDGFGSSGGTMVTNPNHMPEMTDDKQSSRVSPQEHVDLMPYKSPSSSQLYHVNPVQTTDKQTVCTEVTGLDRKCPLCLRDFAHISMDEFQTHVFECFDRAEESINDPDPFQAEKACPNDVQSGQRACPICDRKFSADTSQTFFEGHVQSHFVDVTDQFEVLDVQVP